MKLIFVEVSHHCRGLELRRPPRRRQGLLSRPVIFARTNVVCKDSREGRENSLGSKYLIKKSCLGQVVVAAAA